MKHDFLNAFSLPYINRTSHLCIKFAESVYT